MKHTEKPIWPESSLQSILDVHSTYNLLLWTMPDFFEAAPVRADILSSSTAQKILSNFQIMRIRC